MFEYLRTHIWLCARLFGAYSKDKSTFQENTPEFVPDIVSCLSVLIVATYHFVTGSKSVAGLTSEKIQEMLSAHFQEMEKVLGTEHEAVSYVYSFFTSPLYKKSSEEIPLLGKIEELMKKQCDGKSVKEFEGTRAKISSCDGLNVASSELNEEINDAITDLLERLSEKLEPEGSIGIGETLASIVSVVQSRIMDMLSALESSQPSSSANGSPTNNTFDDNSLVRTKPDDTGTYKSSFHGTSLI